jgi:hypothetical protein
MAKFEPTHEPEFLGAVDLCDANGRLNPEAVGWSRAPLHRCNVIGHEPRKKRWNYWAVHDDRVFFSATIADVDHYALAFVYLLEFETDAGRGRFIERTAILPAGAIDMPGRVRESVAFEQGGRRVGLIDTPRGTRILVEWPDFVEKGIRLTADLLVEQKRGHETLNVVIPWSRDRFQFTSKQNTLPAHGNIFLGKEKFRLERSSSWGVLDFGRGVWKQRTAWNWGACSTRLPDGRALGLNLGGKWTDGTGMTENAICLDGALSKIGDDIPFVYDEARRNAGGFMKPWRIGRRSGRVDLRFVPFYERVAKAKTGILSSEVHQMFGRYSGTVVPDTGETIALVDVFGWIEEHRARW